MTIIPVVHLYQIAKKKKKNYHQITQFIYQLYKKQKEERSFL